MKNKSEMNTLRYMIHRLKGQIFETRMFYFNCSKDMSFDSFRKYVSRLVEEKELIQIAKGIYYIGDQLPENIGELVQDYFLSDTGSCYGGETLLYYLGISEKEPKEVVILNSHISSNKNIWNMIIKKVPPFPGTTAERELFELLSLQHLIDDNNDDMKAMYAKEVAERLPNSQSEWNLFMSRLKCGDIVYPRIVYFRLAEYIKPLHISNEVMEWYESKISSSKNPSRI